ncbi:MAG: methyltransferase domain-containing protein [Candidatus Angelobacter sp.]
MNPISLYEFGSGEDEVRQIQAPFVDLFRHSAPVLDVGCGRGVFLELLAAAGIEAVGLDHSPESVSICQGKGYTVHCEGARQYLERNAGWFGGIFCHHVIEHMGYEEAMAFLGQCHLALRPGGTLLLGTPNPEDIAVISELFWLDPTHVRPYPHRLLQSMLKASGFKIKFSRQYLGSWRMIGRRNLPMYLFRRMLLGRHYGKPNTLVLAEKEIQTAEAPTGRSIARADHRS